MAFNYHIGHCCTAVVLCFLDVEPVHFGHHRNVPWFLEVPRAPQDILVPCAVDVPLESLTHSEVGSGHFPW